jgi:hypothetical protein
VLVIHTSDSDLFYPTAESNTTSSYIFTGLGHLRRCYISLPSEFHHQSTLRNRPTIPINRIPLKPPQPPNAFNPLLLALLPIRHIPTAASRIAANHREPTLDILQQSMRNARRDNNHISLTNRFLDPPRVILMTKTQPGFTMGYTEDFV